MILFRKNKKSEVVLQSKRSYCFFQQWEKVKRRIASYLQRQSELLSLASKKIMLLFFLLVCSAGSIILIISATTKSKYVVYFKQISKPSSTINNTDILAKGDSVITKKDYERIERYKSYLLQLKNDSISKKEFDSIMLQRPHLLDSITLFEKMYLSQ
jgi:hypothetical protein